MRGDGAGKIIGRPVHQYTKDGQFLREWHSQQEAGRVLGIPSASISAVARGYARTAGGYVWRHADGTPPIEVDEWLRKAKERYARKKEKRKALSHIDQRIKELGGEV
jgi:hypothetical protein